MKQEFVASVEHHADALTIDQGWWCVRIYEQPDRLIAQTAYMKEDAARALAKKLNAQFVKS
jgi:hypothetical protein